MVEKKPENKTVKKPVIKQEDAVTLWEKTVEPIPMKKFHKETADTENLLLFSESGGGKTRGYLLILQYLYEKGVKPEDLYMVIIYPDRPQGINKLYGFIPEAYQERVDILPVTDYESTVVATATAVKKLNEHYTKTGKYGWLVFELLENYWTFAQDFFCRKAYGQTMGEFFAQMQDIMSKEKADKKTAYEAFAGPFGGPWPIIKFFHNFNWIDKIKRMPFHKVFTAELREEDNKDSVFYELGFRPGGEKHNIHKMDTALYLSHKGNNFFIKPYKLTGYTKLYGEINVTGKNIYTEHKKACKRLEELGYKVSKIKDLEQQAGIKPPEKKPEKPKEEKTVKTISKGEDGKEEEGEISKEEITTPANKEKTKEEEWII